MSRTEGTWILNTDHMYKNIIYSSKGRRFVLNNWLFLFFVSILLMFLLTKCKQILRQIYSFSDPDCKTRIRIDKKILNHPDLKHFIGILYRYRQSCGSGAVASQTFKLEPQLVKKLWLHKVAQFLENLVTFQQFLHKLKEKIGINLDRIRQKKTY